MYNKLSSNFDYVQYNVYFGEVQNIESISVREACLFQLARHNLRIVSLIQKIIGNKMFSTCCIQRLLCFLIRKFKEKKKKRKKADPASKDPVGSRFGSKEECRRRNGDNFVVSFEMKFILACFTVS